MPVRRVTFWCSALFLAGLAVYFLASHYVMAYSDPASWLTRGQRLLQGIPVTSRPPLFPLFCGLMTKLAGPAWVFLANLPILMLLTTLVGMSAKGLMPSKADAPKKSVIPRELVAFTCMCLFVWSNFSLLLSLLNPYREALAFSLLFGSILLLFRCLDTKRPWQALVAGVLLGLAIGGRETCVLMLPGAGLLYLHALITRKNEFPYIKVALCFGAGLLIGVTPLLIQNAMHTGLFWLPSYARGRVVSMTGEMYVMNDIPVPGMFIGKFFETGAGTLLFFYNKYAWWGLFLLVLGLGVSIRRRYWRVLLFSVPGICINILFYSFYWYVKDRYLFIVDLFAFPIMAIGLVALLSGVYGFVPALTRKVETLRLAFNVTAITLLVLSLCFMGSAIAHREERLKVWHVPALRAAIAPMLKEPFVFVSSRKHYRNMLAWLLQVESPAYGGQRIGIGDVVDSGLEVKLRETGRATLDFVTHTNAYYYGDRHPLLLLNWCEFDRVMSLGDLPVPLDHYGRRLTEDLYEVKLWSQTQVAARIACGSGTQHLLLLDGYRLWDYPGRSFCHLYLNGQKISNSITNSLNLVPFETERADVAAVDLRLVSDAPLPSSLSARSVAINADLDMPLGAVAPFWCYPLLSEELRTTSVMKPGACIMLDGGTLTLPHFATSNNTVFALLHTELYQEDAHFRDRQQEIEFRIGEQLYTRTLPGRRQARWMALNLGRGTGAYHLVPVEMSTQLPGYKEQRYLKDHKRIADMTYVKFASVRLLSVPRTLEGPLHIDIGAEKDALFVLGGFHGSERISGDTSARWTSGQGRLRIPPPSAMRGYDVRVIIINVRPESLSESPTFRINGKEVLASALTVRVLPHGRSTEYTIRVRAEAVPLEEDSVLEILSHPWVPAEFMSTDDDRKLGHMVDTVDVSPIL
jgi:hypothetical protein